MDQKFNKNANTEKKALSDEQVAGVSGGYDWSGYGPGEECPMCGGKIVDDNYRNPLDGMHRSRCSKCGEIWWFDV